MIKTRANSPYRRFFIRGKTWSAQATLPLSTTKATPPPNQWRKSGGKSAEKPRRRFRNWTFDEIAQTNDDLVCLGKCKRRAHEPECRITLRWWARSRSSWTTSVANHSPLTSEACRPSSIVICGHFPSCSLSITFGDAGWSRQQRLISVASHGRHCHGLP